MKKFSAFITLFSFLWASEPLTLPIAESGEQKILTRMASTPEWQGEIQLAPTLDEQIQMIKDCGHTIQWFQSPSKAVFFNPSDKLKRLQFEDPSPFVLLLDTSTEVKTWLVKEIIPFLNLIPSRQDAFIEDFLFHIGSKETFLIWRKLTIEVEPTQ